MRKLSFILLLALGIASLTATQPVRAQSYVLSLNGKAAGSAQASSREAGSGYQTAASGNIKVEGLALSFSRTSQLDKKSELQSSHLSGVVNGQAVTLQIDLTPGTGATAGKFNIATSANGTKSNAALAYHPHTVLLPDFDPGALQTLVNVADQNNYRGLWVLIPKEKGEVYPLKIATLADEKGTLAGKPVKVHHLQLSYNNLLEDLFVSEHAELLQAESIAQAYAIVRKDFTLKPPSRPGTAPPHEETGQPPAGQP